MSEEKKKKKGDKKDEKVSGRKNPDGTVDWKDADHLEFLALQSDTDVTAGAHASGLVPGLKKYKGKSVGRKGFIDMDKIEMENTTCEKVICGKSKIGIKPEKVPNEEGEGLPETTAEAEKKAEADTEVEADKEAEADKEVEADKEAEADKEVEADKEAEADKESEPKKSDV